MRIGPLDLVTLRYAIEVCGGPQFFDSLAITWFDQVQALGKWETCYRYHGADDPNYFEDDATIKVRPYVKGDELAQIEHQKVLAQQLFKCRPSLNTYDVHNFTPNGMFKLITGTIKHALKVPVKILSIGPNEVDKMFI